MRVPVGLHPGDEQVFARALDLQMRSSAKGSASWGDAPLIEKVEWVRSRSLLYYTASSYDYLRITVARPQLVGAAVRALEQDGEPEHTYEATESKPSKYEERFMIDAGLVGGGWVHIHPGRYSLVDDAGAIGGGRIGCAQLLIEATWSASSPPLTGTTVASTHLKQLFRPSLLRVRLRIIRNL